MSLFLKGFKPTMLTSAKQGYFPGCLPSRLALPLTLKGGQLMISSQFHMQSRIHSQIKCSPVAKFVQKRSFSSSRSSLLYGPPFGRNRKDFFNDFRGSPFGPPTIWDAVKVIGATIVIGGFFFFVAFPFLIFAIPTIFIGGFIASRIARTRRISSIRKFSYLLEKTSLKYTGSILNQAEVAQFALRRVSDALETNEKGITDALYRNQDFEPSRLSIGESFDLRSERRINRSGIEESLFFVRYQVLDHSPEVGNLGIIELALRARASRSFQESTQSFDAVVAFRPPLRFVCRPYIFTQPSVLDDNENSNDIIDIKPRRTRRL